MTRATLWAVGPVLILGCGQPPERFPDETAGAADPRESPEVAPTLVRDAFMGAHLTAVDVPRSSPGKPQSFVVGHEGEHRGWVATLPERETLASVAYGDGKLFVGGGFGSTSMYALDASTGKRLWTNQNLEDSGPTPAVYEDGRIVFNTFSCTMFSVDADTGKTLWSKWIGSETPTQPALVGDLVLASHPGESGGYQLSAYKQRSGGQVWSSALDAEILTAPVIAGDSVYVSTTAGSVYRFGLDGKRRWRQQLAAASAPFVVVADDELHLARRAGGREEQVVLAAADGSLRRTVTSTPGGRDIPGTSSFADFWSFEGSRPVVVDGVAYAGMPDRVEAREAASGKLLWVRRHPGGVSGRAVGSVVVVDTQVIFVTRKGELYGLDRGTGVQRWGFDFGQRVTAQPVVAKGWIYIAGQRGKVIGFELGDDQTMDGWHMWGGSAGHNGAAL